MSLNQGKSKKNQKSKLYKCVLTSDIRIIPDLTEYLKCESKKILENMFNNCFTISGSMYFGYHKVTISPMKVSNFPEVKTMQIKCK